MRQIFQKIAELPFYFKVMVIGVLLLNLSAFSGFQAKGAMDSSVNQLTTSLAKITVPMEVKNKELAAGSETIQDSLVEVSIMEKPTQANYLYFSKDTLNVSVNGQSSEISYTANESKEELLTTIAQTLLSFSAVAFIISTLKYLLMNLLLLTALVVASLVLSKFKLKAKKLIFPLLISVLMGGILMVVSSVWVTSTFQFLIFGFALGCTYAGLVRLEMDQKISSYYMGEGVY